MTIQEEAPPTQVSTGKYAFPINKSDSSKPIQVKLKPQLLAVKGVAV